MEKAASGSGEAGNQLADSISFIEKYKAYLAISAVGLAFVVVAAILGLAFSSRKGNSSVAASGTNTSEVNTATHEPTTQYSQTVSTKTSTMNSPPVTTGISVGHPLESEIKNDLIGEKLNGTGTGSGLKFESLREFQRFNIINESENGDLLEISISLRLRDYNTGAYYDADVLIVYKLEGGIYHFISVTGTYEKV